MSAPIEFIHITAIMMGYITSGSYGGSLPSEVFPSTYNATYYAVSEEKNESLKKEYQEALDSFLDDTKVNNSISLRAYFTLVKNNNQEELQKVHLLYETDHAKGNSHVALPSLFFLEGSDQPAFTLNPSNVKLSGIGQTLLYTFLSKHAKQYSSGIPDELFVKYYKKYIY